MIPVSRGLTWAFAALLAVAATPTIYAASDSAAARSKLSAELPAGVTLARANCDQTAGAIKEAVAKDHDMATSILASGILARTPRGGKDQLACECVVRMTRAAVASDVQDASKLVGLAASMRPDCADALNTLVSGDANSPGLFPTADEYAFGVGFGPGFPGSPGFVGSPPSGAVALPLLPTPSPTPVTMSTNG